MTTTQDPRLTEALAAIEAAADIDALEAEAQTA